MYSHGDFCVFSWRFFSLRQQVLSQVYVFLYDVAPDVCCCWSCCCCCCKFGCTMSHLIISMLPNQESTIEHVSLTCFGLTVVFLVFKLINGYVKFIFGLLFSSLHVAKYFITLWFWIWNDRWNHKYFLSTWCYIGVSLFVLTRVKSVAYTRSLICKSWLLLWINIIDQVK